MPREMYEVQNIVNMKESDGKRKFRIKWAGFPTWQNTWEPEEHLKPELIQAFLLDQERKKQKRIRKPSIRPIIVDQHKIILPKKKGGLKILSMCFQKDGESPNFNVIHEGRRKSIGHEFILKHFPEKLARFYRNSYLKKKEK